MAQTTAGNPVLTQTVREGNTTTPPAAAPLEFTQASYLIPRNETAANTSGVEFGGNFSFTVAANGYLDNLVLTITASGGSATSGSTTSNAVMAPDAPWNVIQNITLFSPGGTKPLYVVSGYQAYLITMFGGYRVGNPTNWPEYSAPNSGGNFAVPYYIPIAFIRRMALGALANMNAASLFEVSITFAPSSAVYSTPPATLPTLSVSCKSENWTKPAPQSAGPRPVPQMQEPPLLGTTQYWMSQKSGILTGDTEYISTQVGNVIRNFILITRDASTGQRVDALPDLTRVELNDVLIDQLSPNIIARKAQKWYPNVGPLPTGVYPYPLCTDWDGQAGEELRNQYIATTNSDKLSFSGDWGTTGVQLEILTNYIAFTGPYLTQFQG